MSPILSFNRLALFIKKGSGNAIPNDIIVQHLWPLLSHPHQGRLNQNVCAMNQCIKQLPRPKVNLAPRIIYKNLIGIIRNHIQNHADNTRHEVPSYASIKFVYSLRHSKKFPQRSINIIEHILIDHTHFDKTKLPVDKTKLPVDTLSENNSNFQEEYTRFTRIIRQWYLEPSTFIEDVCVY